MLKELTLAAASPAAALLYASMASTYIQKRVPPCSGMLLKVKS
jgi:hypothetical protein